MHLGCQSISIDHLPWGRGSSIKITHLTFDLNLGKKHTVVNGCRAVGGSSCGWKQQLEQTNLHRSLHPWVILLYFRLSSSLLLVSATAANFQLPIDLCMSFALPNRGYYSSARATIGPHVINMMSLVCPRMAGGLYSIPATSDDCVYQ